MVITKMVAKEVFPLDSTRKYFVIGHINTDWFFPKEVAVMR